MKQMCKIRRRAVSLLTIAMLVFGLFVAVPADTASAAENGEGNAFAAKKESIKTEKENYLTDEQYETTQTH